MKNKLKNIWNRRGEVNLAWTAFAVAVVVAVGVLMFFILRYVA